MINITNEQWENFYILIGNMSKEILNRIDTHVKANNYVSPYWSYPHRINKDNYGGWNTVSELSPYARLSLSENRYDFADYSSLLSIRNEEKKICILELDSYTTCYQFLNDNSHLLSYIWYKEVTEDIGIAILILLEKIVNRYIYMTGKYAYEEETFRDIYTSVSNIYFLKTLEFDICIPILFVRFDDDNIPVNANISITKMSDDFIKSKHFIGNYDAQFEKIVLDCTTHMIVIKGYELQNNDFRSEDILENWRVYPLDIINIVFASIRVITGLQTGYAQIVVSPTNNWVSKNCKGDLIGLTGTKAKEYPDFFLEHFWLQPCNYLNNKVGLKIAELTSTLLENCQNAFNLACNRLNKSMLRNSEDDTILDAIIGLELLLSDNDKGELTYKISSRMATLSTLQTDCLYTPIEVQQSVAKIYRYRSDIVHSRKLRNSTKLIKINQEIEIPTVTLAIRYLSMAIEILARNPVFLDPKKIDELMMAKLQHPKCE